MREQIKQQIRKSLVTLSRAEAVLDSKTKAKDEEMVNQLLTEMQETAIAAGQEIEDEEGEGTETVGLLEEYCELLWQYLNAETLNGRFKLGRVLAGTRSKISASLEKEISGVIHVVFLLCQAKRWQQMERLWEVAKNTPGYHCQVVVSPYGSRLPDGRMGLVHDELEMFPEELGAVAYDEYDIRYWEPDLVYMDGPYAGEDMPGIVPDYDFEEVRLNSEVLIYMPVYDEGEVIAEADCLLPQVKQADIIQVTSEAVKREYAAILERKTGDSELVSRIQVREMGSV